MQHSSRWLGQRGIQPHFDSFESVASGTSVLVDRDDVGGELGVLAEAVAPDGLQAHVGALAPGGVELLALGLGDDAGSPLVDPDEELVLRHIEWLVADGAGRLVIVRVVDAGELGTGQRDHGFSPRRSLLRPVTFTSSPYPMLFFSRCTSTLLTKISFVSFSTSPASSWARSDQVVMPSAEAMPLADASARRASRSLSRTSSSNCVQWGSKSPMEYWVMTAP